jgi:2-hydroxychromene-2-carboxylate isomerase
MTRLAWFFDYVSPYAYLQFAAHPDLMQRDDVELVPIVFAGLLRHWAHKGPAELPTKRPHTYRHTTWLAGRLGVPFRYPPGHPFNSLHALRLTIAAGSTYEAIRTVNQFIWGEGRSVGDEWGELGRRLGIDDPDAAANTPAVKDALRANGDRALAAGVFGVPTFTGGGHLFWGLDATDMLRDWLADPALFDSAEMRRISSLPVAAARRDA